ncbi:hypothetical protein [Hyalangium gracile]|uniref:hypothetical protein n=1 Tax=Hyalangium gracile TaxID=394092 RepID=UPI001CCAA8D1|nr:hypothetical protein [Hyalangium gracile]
MSASTWHVFDPKYPDQILATLRFQPGVAGQSGHVTIEADGPDVHDFLMLYLDDPFNHHPVFIEGLGFLKGPHSTELEQFERAISLLGRYFPSFAARRVEGR